MNRSASNRPSRTAPLPALLIGLLLLARLHPAAADAPGGRSTSVPPGEGEAAAGRSTLEQAHEPPPGGPEGPQPLPPAHSGSDWIPPPPSADGDDWIQLEGGEWLRGRIKAMRRDKLEFDSENLDELTLDWEDVVVLLSPRLRTYVFEGPLVVTGTAVMRDRWIFITPVREGEDAQAFAREDLVSIVRGRRGGLRAWSGKATVGVTFRRGNTNQAEFAANGFVRRQTPLTRLRLDYNGSMGSLNGEENVNNHRGNLKLDIFLSRRLYATPAAVTAYRDTFQNVAVRVTPSAGLGYQAVDRARIELEVESGLGYQYSRSVSVPVTGDLEEHSGVGVVTTRLHTELTKSVDFDVTATALLAFPAFGATTYHALAELSVELTRILDLDVSFTWDRVQEPVPDDQGNVPQRDDSRLYVGLGVDF